MLGVDPGSRAAGWAIVEFGGPSPILGGAGVLRPPTTGPFATRLLTLRIAFADVLSRERPDVAVVERVFSGVNPESLIRLGEARGVLLLALAEAGVPIHEVTPAEIKKVVTGSGGAEKEQVRRMVASLLGRTKSRPLALDAADAAAAALAHGFRSIRGGVRAVAPAPSSAPREIRRGPAG
ncbi:MAG TPA: crossover junction endodeoxyribonuclease RuvC [Thermoanaerobaculia bacterium]|nr:crossover junction endodeoxyribonuclease RuvC [Thermoanaerobaculia bacterium]